MKCRRKRRHHEQGSRRSPALSFSSGNGPPSLNREHPSDACRDAAKSTILCVGPALRARATRTSHMPGGSPRHRSKDVEMKRRWHQWHRAS